MQIILKPCENNACGKSHSLKCKAFILGDCAGKCEWCMLSCLFNNIKLIAL